MSDGEQRWTVCVDGDAVRITLWPRTSMFSWLPVLLLVPAQLAIGAPLLLVGGGFVVVTSTRLQGLHFAVLFVALGLFVGLTGLAFLVSSVTQGFARLSWLMSGREHVSVLPDSVRIERDGFGIRKVATFRRTPGTGIVAGTQWLFPYRRMHWGLPRIGTAGPLRVKVQGGADIRFGLDLARDEAVAILAELELIRDASRPHAVTT